MCIRLVLLGVVMATALCHVTATNDKLNNYFWNYAQYVSFLETSTEEASIASYSSNSSIIMDQQHGNTPTSGHLHHASSTLRNFQRYLNIPSREEFPTVNATDFDTTPCGLLQNEICRPFDCSSVDGDPIHSRRIDGKCNNPQHPLWGSALVSQQRLHPGVWENVANSLFHNLTLQRGIPFTDISFMGAVSDFKEPFTFKVKGGGGFILAGHDSNGERVRIVIGRCVNGCLVRRGAIISYRSQTRGCTARFQRLSNKLYAEGVGCQLARYTVIVSPYLFKVILRPSSMPYHSSLTTALSTVFSNDNKHDEDDATQYWLKVDDDRISVSSGSEFSEEEVFLSSTLPAKINETSISVLGLNRPTFVQFVSRDVLRTSTDDFNSPLPLDNIPFTYSHQTLRFGIQGFGHAVLKLTGKPGTSSDGVSVTIEQDGVNVTITDSRTNQTSVHDIGSVSSPDFTTASGVTYDGYRAVWVAWYGNEVFLGCGNTIANCTLIEYAYEGDDFWFEVGSVEIGSYTETRWIFDIEQQGTPRSRSMSSGNPLASPLDIAQLVHKGTSEKKSWSPSLTMATFQYGQFLDHDIIATPTVSINGHAPICCTDGINVEDGVYSDDACFNIGVNTDRITVAELAPFNPVSSECLSFVRSSTILDCSNDQADDRQRNPINAITSFIDGSNVYGSDEKTLESVRDGDTCFLLIEEGELPFAKHAGEACAPMERCRYAGDFRSQEQPMLAAMHTLFVREHNRIARTMIDENGYSNDDECFYAVKNIVIAEIQVITEDGFLPSFLNKDVLNRFNLNKGDNTCLYCPSVNGGITAEFGIVYRMGHSWISDDLVGYGGNSTADMALANNFFSPRLSYKSGGSDYVLRGMPNACSRTDRRLESSVTDFLFSNLGPASNLGALNIQRGRDHGVPTYTGMLKYLGLPVPNNIDELVGIVSNETIPILKRVYDSVDDIDLFTGALIEEPMEGSRAGPLINEVVARQMELLKLGDRFWYTCYFSDNAVKRLQKVTLGRVLCDNTDNTDFQMQKDVFRQESPTNRVIDCAKRPKVNLRWFTPRNNGRRDPSFGDDVEFGKP